MEQKAAENTENKLGGKRYLEYGKCGAIVVAVLEKDLDYRSG